MRHGRTSAVRLAEVFEVSVRTIQRDMDTLGKAGIPIWAEVGVNGGYEIMDTFVMDKQLVNEGDYSWLIAALKGLNSAYQSKSVEQTMDKLVAMTEPKDSIIQVDFSVARENLDVNGKIAILEEAIREKRLVGFTYTNNENVSKKLQVEPARIEFKWYNWYLIGYHQEHQDYCMFKLVRMEELCMLNTESTMKHTKKDIVIQDHRKVITVELHGNAVVKSKCKEYLRGEIVREYPNGEFDFTFNNRTKEFN